MQRVTQADLIEPKRSARVDLSGLSDDECLARLARVIEAHDLANLDEMAQLIGRLAVTIE